MSDSHASPRPWIRIREPRIDRPYGRYEFVLPPTHGMSPTDVEIVKDPSTGNIQVMIDGVEVVNIINARNLSFKFKASLESHQL